MATRLESVEQFAAEYPELDVSAVVGSLTLLRVGSQLLDAFDQLFSSYGLSNGRFSVMMTLRYRRNGLSPAELAEIIGVTRPTMTGLLDTLERGGIIERRPHPDDARAQMVTLSRSGKARLDRVLPSHFRRHSMIMSNLSRAEREQLVKLLEKVQLQLVPTESQ
ncbi:MAG: MarR family transcriptional regulator [Polyangiaceae bacterium]